MSAFFVGQRVRIVAAHTYHPMVGVEAVIVSGPHTVQGRFAWELSVHVPERPFARFAEPWQLEPVIPDGMKPARWEDCVWQPEGVAA
jgi:hypothetical protein